ncbi:MAG: DegV family protein [Longicatena sp.]
MKIAILTDSGCALSPKEGLEKGIYILPLQVVDGDQTFRDSVEITTEDLYERLRKNHTPKTSLPILSDIKETIDNIKEAGFEEIIALPLSSGLSSTFNSIRVVAQDANIPITHIENYTTCDLQYHSVQLAKQYVDEGLNAKEIKEKLEHKIQHSGTLILPNDIQHLKRGGRLTPLAAAAASLLKIKPILKIDPSTNGKIDVFSKVRTEKKAQQVAIEYISEQMKESEGCVYVIHSDNLAKAQEIRKELKDRNPQLEIHIHTICAVIAAHTGLDCIAIQYIEK